jgi:hypothetical protein
MFLSVQGARKTHAIIGASKIKIGEVGMQRLKRIVLSKAEGIGIRQILRTYIFRKLGAYVDNTDGHMSLGAIDTADKMMRECVYEKHVRSGDDTIRFFNILTPQKLKLIIETAQEVGATDLAEAAKITLFTRILNSGI